jgi:hypothetical protein
MLRGSFVGLTDLDVPIRMELTHGDAVHVTSSSDATAVITIGNNSHEEILLRNAQYASNARHNLVSVLMPPNVECRCISRTKVAL